MDHIPVLENEIVTIARSLKSPQYYLDGTLGRGGHARRLMNEFSGLHMLGIDQDRDAIEFADHFFEKEKQEGRVVLSHQNFSELRFEDNLVRTFTKGMGFDLILLDLGVSSPQLDEAHRGFSFYHQGPLDMRMDQRLTLTAADVLNSWTEKELSDLFYHLGELKFPNKVVRAIVERRRTEKFKNTQDLSILIEKVCGWGKKGHHPATQYFLALRLQVNNELGVVEEAIPEMMKMLANEGLLFVITFHSLEDRIVKNIFRNSGEWGEPVNKKVVQARWDEKKENPRARSAKLRVFRRKLKE